LLKRQKRLQRELDSLKSGLNEEAAKQED